MTKHESRALAGGYPFVIRHCRGLRHCRSENLEGGLLVLLDVKELVEPGDLEDFVDGRVDAAQHQLAAGGGHLLVERDELAEGGAREVLDVAEVEEQPTMALLVD